MIFNKDRNRLNYPVVDVIETASYLIIQQTLYDKKTLSKLSSDILDIGYGNINSANYYTWTMANSAISYGSGLTGTANSQLYPSGNSQFFNMDDLDENIASGKDNTSNYEVSLIGDRIVLIDTVSYKVTLKTIPDSVVIGAGIFLGQNNDYMYFYYQGQQDFGSNYVAVYEKATQSIVNYVHDPYSTTSWKSPMKLLKSIGDTVYMYQGVWNTRRIISIRLATNAPAINQVANSSVNYSSDSLKMIPGKLINNKSIWFYLGNGTFDIFKANYYFNEYTLDDTGIYSNTQLIPTEQPTNEYDMLSKKVRKKMWIDDYDKTDFDAIKLLDNYIMTFKPTSTYNLFANLTIYLGKAYKELHPKYVTVTSNTELEIVYKTTKTLNYTTASDFNNLVLPIPENYTLEADEIRIKLTGANVYSPNANNNLRHGIYPREVVDPQPTSTYGGCLLASNGTLAITILQRGNDLRYNISKITYLPCYKTYCSAESTLSAWFTNEYNETITILYSDKNNTGNNVVATANSEASWSPDNPATIVLTLPHDEMVPTFNKIIQTYMALSTTYYGGVNNYKYNIYRVLTLGNNTRYIGLSMEFTYLYSWAGNNPVNVPKYMLFKLTEADGEVKKIELVDWWYGKEIFYKGSEGPAIKVNDNTLMFMGSQTVTNIAFNHTNESIDVTRFNIPYYSTGGRDREGRLFFKLADGTTHDIVFPQLPASVSFEYLDPNDSYIGYEGTSIEKQVKVKTMDIYGQPIKALVELRIAGSNCVFKESGSSTLRKQISESGEALIALTITSTGNITLNGDILYDGELETVTKN